MGCIVAILAAVGAFAICLFFDKTNQIVYEPWNLTIRHCIVLCVAAFVLKNWSSK